MVPKDVRIFVNRNFRKIRETTGTAMAIDYTEKRSYIRMKTDSRITFQQEGSNHSYEGQCVDLSAAGVLFLTDQRFAPGTRLNINITPQLSVVPPLDAIIEVVRSQLHSNGSFAIAGQIKEMH
jgi:hypothetical protein